MKLQWMKDILGESYTEELDGKVCTALGERFVSREDFNGKVGKLREAEAQVTQLTQTIGERDRQPPPPHRRWLLSLINLPPSPLYDPPPLLH